MQTTFLDEFKDEIRALRRDFDSQAIETSGQSEYVQRNATVMTNQSFPLEHKLDSVRILS